MKHKSHNPIDPLYAELQEEDRKYGGKRLEKPQSEVSKIGRAHVWTPVT